MNQTTDTEKMQSSSHLIALDGLRGIAILMVMLRHFYNEDIIQESYPMIGPILTKIALAGNYGVELFFVLSGFLITQILLDTKMHHIILTIFMFGDCSEYSLCTMGYFSFFSSFCRTWLLLMKRLKTLLPGKYGFGPICQIFRGQADNGIVPVFFDLVICGFFVLWFIFTLSGHLWFTNSTNAASSIFA